MRRPPSIQAAATVYGMLNCASTIVRGATRTGSGTQTI